MNEFKLSPEIFTIKGGFCDIKTKTKNNIADTLTNEWETNYSGKVDDIFEKFAKEADQNTKLLSIWSKILAKMIWKENKTICHFWCGSAHNLWKITKHFSKLNIVNTDIQTEQLERAMENNWVWSWISYKFDIKWDKEKYDWIPSKHTMVALSPISLEIVLDEIRILNIDNINLSDIKKLIEWKSANKIELILKSAWLESEKIKEIINKWVEWSNRKKVMKEQFNALKPGWVVMYLETPLKKVINNSDLQKWFKNEVETN